MKSGKCPHADIEWYAPCASYYCIDCGEDHLTSNRTQLARCWCGFSKTQPGWGRAELIEMGENLD